MFIFKLGTSGFIKWVFRSPQQKRNGTLGLSSHFLQDEAKEIFGGPEFMVIIVWWLMIKYEDFFFFLQNYKQKLPREDSLRQNPLKSRICGIMMGFLDMKEFGNPWSQACGSAHGAHTHTHTHTLSHRCRGFTKFVLEQ